MPVFIDEKTSRQWCQQRIHCVGKDDKLQSSTGRQTAVRSLECLCHETGTYLEHADDRQQLCKVGCRTAQSALRYPKWSHNQHCITLNDWTVSTALPWMTAQSALRYPEWSHIQHCITLNDHTVITALPWMITQSALHYPEWLNSQHCITLNDRTVSTALPWMTVQPALLYPEWLNSQHCITLNDRTISTALPWMTEQSALLYPEWTHSQHCVTLNDAQSAFNKITWSTAFWTFERVLGQYCSDSSGR